MTMSKHPKFIGLIPNGMCNMKNTATVRKSDVLFVFHMDHGGDDGMDKKKRIIREAYLNPLLKRESKVKLIVIVFQSCRGGNRLEDVFVDGGRGKPTYYILFYATSEGCVSYRELKGSPFIQKFCQQIRDHQDEMGIIQIMNRVNETMQAQRATKETNLGSKDFFLTTGLSG